MFIRAVWSLLMLLAATPLTAAGVTDFASVRKSLPLTEGIDWCRAPLAASREEIAGGGCEFKALTRDDRNVGFAADSIWLRLRLKNSSAQDSELWLQVGHPRLTEVTIYQRDPEGRWRSDRLGYGVPPAERVPVARHYGVMPVAIAAGGSADVWVRIVSDSAIDLETLLWERNAYRVFRQAADAWLSIAMGGLVFGLMFSFLIFVSSGQKQFGFFSIALVGELILSLIRNGILLRFVWPDNLPIPIALTSVGGMLVVIGMCGYLYTAIPTVRQMPEEHLAIRTLAFMTLGFQLYSIFGDFRQGTMIWLPLATTLLILLAWVSLQAWRRGEMFARWIFIAFLALGVAVALRVPDVSHRLPEIWADILLAPFSMLIVVALLLVALIERSKNLERQLRNATLATNAQVEFLSRMSHELRTPLDSVLGNAQLLMRSSDRMKKAPELAGIVSSGRHLLRLIDEILDYAKGTAGALRLQSEPVELTLYLHEIDSTAQLLAARNRNKFELTLRPGSEKVDGIVLEFDGGRLRQVLDNLIVNAARHTRDGTIALDYALVSDRDGAYSLSFALKDTGDGISLADQERIFRPFERVGRAEQYGGKGAGMGLAIARQLVELMGGRLTVDSTPGSGSTFRFSIKVRPVGPGLAEVIDSEPSPLEARGYAGRPRIACVIDDDPGGRAIFAALLQRAGFEVHEAESGYSAIELMARLETLDVVVTDQFMPDGDGWAVLEAIHRARPEVPVVMISAAPASRPEGIPRELRFAGEFLKPVDHGEFLTAIGKLLGLRWAHTRPVARGLDTPPSLRPGDSELSILRDMVELGEITAIREWARGLRERAPQYAGFADRVEASATDLDLSQLETLARRPAS